MMGEKRYPYPYPERPIKVDKRQRPTNWIRTKNISEFLEEKL